MQRPLQKASGELTETPPFFTGAAMPPPNIVQDIEARANRKTRLAQPRAVEAGDHFKKRIDLTDVFPNVWVARDQRLRGTCVAFAAAACVEALIAKQQGVTSELSPEFLYWYMRNEADYLPNPLPQHWDQGATKLWQAMGVLRDLGICEETLAVYDPEPPDLIPEPSIEARQDAESRKRNVGVYWDSVTDGPAPFSKAERIYEELAKDRPVAVGLPMFEPENNFGSTNWDNMSARSTGIVWGPTDSNGSRPTVHAVSAHVVCITGFQPDAAAAGGGWFIFRNSWGQSFGTHPNRNEDRPPTTETLGYGALTARHVDEFCWELLSLA